MFGSSFTRNLSSDDMESFEELLEGNKLPNHLSNIGRTVSASLKYQSFKFSSEEKSYTVQPTPVEGTHTVTDEPTLVEANFLVYDDESVWSIPSDEVDYKILPELRQAFYEGDGYMNREADYRYHFSDEETEIAVRSANPVSRLDEEITFTSVESLGGQFPAKWLLSTDDNEYYYLRERSGTIKLISEAGNGDVVFHAYVGREHPGTHLHGYEVLNIIASVDYINISEDYDDEVPEEAHDQYWSDMGFSTDFNTKDIDELLVDEE